MVQSWQNFMAPTGGYTDNTFQFGIGSLVADLGLSVLGVGVANQQIDALNTKLQQVPAQISGRSGKWQRVNPGTYTTDNTYRDRMVSRFESKLKNRYNRKLGRASAAKWGLRGVGYGYLAMAAANIFESMLSPNYSMTNAAKATDNNMMQMPLDSATAYTQRQRALMAIHDSQLGIRGVIGNESQYFHR